MKKIISKYKKYIMILLSFLIPCLIMTSILFIRGYFKDKVIISSDLRAQYYPLFHYLKGILYGTDSLFYSFNKGVGGTMFGTIFYYMSSPLNVLLAFVFKKNIICFITFLIILKISLCGLSMYIYMSKKYNDSNTKILVFSICYALMGYNINYYMNVMWLDVVFLAPLVLLGIDYIIKKNNPIFYSIVLFISILSNYYMAYMLCIFCVLYFSYEILIKYNLKLDKKIIFSKFKLFIISSLLTGLMCSFFIIPCVIESLNYGRPLSFDKIFTFDYNFFDLFSKSYIGSLNLTNILNYTSMNLYCSEFFLVVLFFYIISKSKNNKKKKITLVFILIMILPAFIGVLNWIWHLFTIPTYLSYRYSFLLCLFIIRICYEEEKNIILNKTNILSFLFIYLLISVYLTIITSGGNYYDFLNYKLIILSVLFVLIYVALLYFSSKKTFKNKIILIIMIFELILNAAIIFSTAKPLDKEIIDEYHEPMNDFSSYNDKNHRIESSFFETMNESLLYRYNGVGNFLSTTNSKIVQFNYHVGNNEYTEYANHYNYEKQNYILDSMLGIKYMLYPYEVNDYEFIKSYKINNVDAFLYKNDNAYNYGYVIKNKCNNSELIKFYDNEIYNCLFNKKDLFYKKIKYNNKSNNILKYNVKKGDYIYIWIEELTDEQKEKIKNENYSNFERVVNINERYMAIQSLSNSLEITIPDNINSEKIEVYYFDYDTFIKQGIPNGINITNINKNQLEAEIELKNEEMIMVTLPYEKGFEVKVDNAPIEYYKVADTFIGFDLSKGYHKISIKYRQPGIKIGLIISILSLILDIVFNTIIIIHNKKHK